MRRAAVLVVLFACLAAAGCGDRGEPGADAARHLDPRSDAVVAVDLDYEGASWQQVKRLYARAVQEGALDEGEFTPPTLDGEPLRDVTQAEVDAALAERDERKAVTIVYQVQDAEALKRVPGELR